MALEILVAYDQVVPRSKRRRLFQTTEEVDEDGVGLPAPGEWEMNEDGVGLPAPGEWEVEENGVGLLAFGEWILDLMKHGETGGKKYGNLQLTNNTALTDSC